MRDASHESHGAKMHRIMRADGGPTGDAITDARSRLAKRLNEQRAVDEDDTTSILDRDREQANRDAEARGDYKGGNYMPWHPDEED